MKVESTKDFMKDMSKDYSFYQRRYKVVKESENLKKSLKEKRTYVKKGNEYTLLLMTKGKLQSALLITYSKGMLRSVGMIIRMLKDYKKELKTYSDQYDEYKGLFNYGYGASDYGYGYSDDYGSGSKSGL
ncbi:MAG: hypothetical protein ACLTZN_09670 [Streptococcus sp.]